MIDPVLDQELKARYHELEHLEKHMSTLSNQLNNLEDKGVELESIKKAIEEVDHVSEGKEILVPISNGIFMRAKIDNTSKLLINVGANTVVEKDLKSSVELVEKQQKELEKFKMNLITQMQTIDEHTYKVEAEIEERIKQSKT